MIEQVNAGVSGTDHEHVPTADVSHVAKPAGMEQFPGEGVLSGPGRHHWAKVGTGGHNDMASGEIAVIIGSADQRPAF